MTLCPCAVVYPDSPQRVRGFCEACKRTGVVETRATRAQWDALFAAGWDVDRRGVLRHPVYGAGRVETALWLAEHDARKAAVATIARDGERWEP